MFGSRTLEKMLKVATDDVKKLIAAELVSSERTIISNNFGFIVWKKCRIDQFKLGAENWATFQDQEAERAKKFQSIIQRENSDNTKPDASSDKKEDKKKRSRKELAGRSEETQQESVAEESTAASQEPLTKKKKEKKNRQAEKAIIPAEAQYPEHANEDLQGSDDIIDFISNTLAKEEKEKKKKKKNKGE